MTKRFRKKPVVVEAVQFTGGGASANAVLEFAKDVQCCWHFNHDTISIPTPEGTMTANPGDWIIRGVKGEFYPCKPDIFAATYDCVNECQECLGTGLHRDDQGRWQDQPCWTCEEMERLRRGQE